MIVEKTDNDEITIVADEEFTVKDRPGGTIVLRAAARSDKVHSVFTADGDPIATIVLVTRGGQQLWLLHMVAGVAWTQNMLRAALTLHGFIGKTYGTPESGWTPGQGMDDLGRGHGRW